MYNLNLVEVRGVFRVTDELCQDTHPLDEEWADLVNLHRTKPRKLCMYQAQSWWEGGNDVHRVRCDLVL